MSWWFAPSSETGASASAPSHYLQPRVSGKTLKQAEASISSLCLQLWDISGPWSISRFAKENGYIDDIKTPPWISETVFERTCLMQTCQLSRRITIGTWKDSVKALSVGGHWDGDYFLRKIGGDRDVIIRLLDHLLA